MSASILLKIIMHVMARFKNDNTELQLNKDLIAVEQLPSEAQKKHARAALISAWVKRHVSASEAKYLLAQDDRLNVLFERTLARGYVRFDAATCGYRSVKTVPANSWRHKNLPPFSSGSFTTSIQQYVGMFLLLLFTACTAFLFMGAFNVGLQYWLGNLSSHLQFAKEVIMLTPLAAMATGTGIVGISLSNQVVANAAADRLIKRSSTDF